MSEEFNVGTDDQHCDCEVVTHTLGHTVGSCHLRLFVEESAGLHKVGNAVKYDCKYWRRRTIIKERIPKSIAKRIIISRYTKSYTCQQNP